MKRFICLFLLTLFLFSCTNVFEPTGAVEPPLTISAFIYNESLEEYTLTPLEAGIVYELAPIGWDGLENINLHFACEGGSVRVLSEDEEVQLSMGNGGGLFRDHREARNYGYEMEITNTGYIAAYPYGCGRGHCILAFEDVDKKNAGYFGKEYYLKVIGYELDRPVVTMALTLTQLESEDSYDGKSSAYFSLEITSVAYSDRYQMMLES